MFDAAEGTGNDVEAKWSQLKSILHEAADKLGYSRKKESEKRRVRKVYSSIKQLAGKNATVSETIKNADGHPFLDSQERREEWAKHFEQLLNRPSPAASGVKNDLHSRFSEVNNDPPILSEVEKVIGKLKSSKVVGLDDIPLSSSLMVAQNLQKN